MKHAEIFVFCQHRLFLTSTSWCSQFWGNAYFGVLAVVLLTALRFAWALTPVFGAWVTYPAMAGLLASLALAGINFLVKEKLLPATLPLQNAPADSLIGMCRQLVSCLIRMPVFFQKSSIGRNLTIL